MRFDTIRTRPFLAPLNESCDIYICASVACLKQAAAGWPDVSDVGGHTILMVLNIAGPVDDRLWS